MSYFPEELTHTDFTVLEAIYQNIEVRVDKLLRLLIDPTSKVDDKKTIEENRTDHSIKETNKSHPNQEEVVMLMERLQSLVNDVVFTINNKKEVILLRAEFEAMPTSTQILPKVFQLKELLTKVEKLVKDRALPIHSPSYLKLLKLKIILKLIDTLKKYNLKGEKSFEAVKQHAAHDIIQAFFKIKTCDFIETLMKVHCDVLVISVGSAGLSLVQQCPNFARTLAKEVVVSVFNIDPAFNKSGFNDELSAKNLNVFQFKGAFGSLSKAEELKDKNESAGDKKANKEQDKSIEDVLYTTMQAALDFQLNNLGARIILIDNTGVFLKKDLIEFCNHQADKFGSQLTVVSCGGLANRPAFVYSKELIIGKSPEQVKAALVSAWEEIAPGKYNKGTDSFEYDAKFNQEVTDPLQYYENRLENLQEKFEPLGKLYRDLDDIPAESLFRSQPKARLKR